MRGDAYGHVDRLTLVGARSDGPSAATRSMACAFHNRGRWTGRRCCRIHLGNAIQAASKNPDGRAVCRLAQSEDAVLAGYLSRRHRVSFAVLAFFLTLAFAHTAFAQITTATVSGTVKDETAGVLPGVDVVVKNRRHRNLPRTAVTDANGSFTITGLMPGPVRGPVEPVRLPDRLPSNSS